MRGLEYIKAYFLNIISVILFTVLVEILMPNSSFKGYIKLVLGLLVILAVVKPITNLTGFNIDSLVDTDQSYVTSTQIEEVQNRQINTVFCDNLENAIETDVKERFNEDVEVSVEADINEIKNIDITGISDERKYEIEKYILETFVGGE